MSRKSSKRISFSPDIRTEEPTVMKQYNAGSRQATRGRRAKKTTSYVCSFHLPKNPILSPLRLLRRIGAGASKAILFMFSRKPAAKPPAVRSRPGSSHGESHHKEAIEDCIEFINSSSFSRSNSVSERPTSQPCACLPTQSTNMVAVRTQKQ
uniref:Josephin-like protein n=1 Tax=Nymphaea colorata TaxID=210225 RepID=A0A5K1D8N9_9MAGN